MTDASSNLTEQESMDGSPCLVTLRHHVEAVEGVAREHSVPFGYIAFQCGPVSEVGINGGTIEDVTRALIARLEGFQKGPFACSENEHAIEHFDRVLVALALRTIRREDQGVEGTNQPHAS